MKNLMAILILMLVKWHKWYDETLEHDDYIDLEDIIFEESCTLHEIDVSSSSVELVHPSSLKFIVRALSHHFYPVPFS